VSVDAIPNHLAVCSWRRTDVELRLQLLPEASPEALFCKHIAAIKMTRAVVHRVGSLLDRNVQRDTSHAPMSLSRRGSSSGSCRPTFRISARPMALLSIPRAMIISIIIALLPRSGPTTQRELSVKRGLTTQNSRNTWRCSSRSPRRGLPRC